MNNWHSWISSLIGLILIIGFFDMLLPDNNMKKMAKLVIGLVILIAVIEPILAVLNFNWSNPSWVQVGTTLEFEVWQSAGTDLYHAGSKPVLQTVAKNAEHQVEALLIVNDAIGDARITISLNEAGAVTKVIAKIDAATASSGRLIQENKHEIEDLARSTIARYLQITEELILIEIS